MNEYNSGKQVSVKENNHQSKDTHFCIAAKHNDHRKHQNSKEILNFVLNLIETRLINSQLFQVVFSGC